MGSTTGSIIVTVEGKDVWVSNTAPENPSNNQLWLDTSGNILKYYLTTDSKWHLVNDMSKEFENISETLETNYYTKKETEDAVTAQIGKTTITTKNGEVVNMKDALNDVIDTAKQHKQTIGELSTEINETKDLVSSIEKSDGIYTVEITYSRKTDENNEAIIDLICHVYTENRNEKLEITDNYEATDFVWKVNTDDMENATWNDLQVNGSHLTVKEELVGYGADFICSVVVDKDGYIGNENGAVIIWNGKALLIE